MIATRFRQIALLLLAVAISALAFIQMFQRTTGAFPVQYAIMLCAAAALFLVFCGLTARFQPYASQSIMPCVLLLTATGLAGQGLGFLYRIALSRQIGAEPPIWALPCPPGNR